MDELKQLEKIQELERQIAGLPIGYISKKTINGKVRYQKTTQTHKNTGKPSSRHKLLHLIFIDFSSIRQENRKNPYSIRNFF